VIERSAPDSRHDAHRCAALVRDQRRAERTEGPRRSSTQTRGLRKKDIMTAIEAFVTRHPVRIYFALAFAVSWAGVLLTAPFLAMTVSLALSVLSAESSTPYS
jgi:hypothetical protein